MEIPFPLHSVIRWNFHLSSLIYPRNQGNAFSLPRCIDTCCGKRPRGYATITLFMLILRAFLRLDRVLRAATFKKDGFETRPRVVAIIKQSEIEKIVVRCS